MFIYKNLLKSNFNFHNAKLICFFYLLFPLLASAANWEINPLRIDLTNEKQTNILTIKNTSDTATTIQIQVLSWSQNGNQDEFEPTRDLLVSPPFVTIPPNSQQIVRTRLRRKADLNSELSYRINLVEISPDTPKEFNGVNVLMQVGLPVFIDPLKGKDEVKLSWTLEKGNDDLIKVTLMNQGKIHIKILDFSLSIKDEKEMLANENIPIYVMAGQSHTWSIKKINGKNITSEKIKIKAFTDRGTLESNAIFTNN